MEGARHGRPGAPRAGKGLAVGASPAAAGHPSWVELDRAALAENLKSLSALVAPSRIMAVVKANAYGAGAVPVARTLAEGGVDAFAVASVAEALELRAASIAGTILVLTYFAPGDVPAILEHDVRPAVFTMESARWLSDGAAARGRRAAAWVKVDTGLGRLGVPFTEAADFVRRVAALPGVAVAGLFSTLAESAERNPVQVERLRRVRAELSEIPGLASSIVSSQGILSMEPAGLTYARPGIALLGVAPSPERLDPALVARAGLGPVVTWKARVAYVKTVPAGEQVGYGPRPPLAGPLRVATLSVGWADGYAQTLTGGGHVLIGGRRCPILAISANSTMVDVSETAAALGDEAVLLGRQGAHVITTGDIAAVIGSFYRVLATIPPAVPRLLT
jgi:alanine racemase